MNIAISSSCRGMNSTDMRSRDFTLDTYERLLQGITQAGYQCITFKEYCCDQIDEGKRVILRHDVDRRPANALEMARLEHGQNIKATYYFRIIKATFDEDIIRAVDQLGHEVGYHYEDLSLVKGDQAKAIQLFEEHLGWFENLSPVTTICMHGSPLSKWDNRSIWDAYDYTDYGIIGEPYFTLDFDKWFYSTDTGRHWNKREVSVRDKVSSSYQYDFNTTDDIARGFQHGELPDKVMINTHPHRWNDNLLAWSLEYLSQRVKNVVKKQLVKRQR